MIIQTKYVYQGKTFSKPEEAIKHAETDIREKMYILIKDLTEKKLNGQFSHDIMVNGDAMIDNPEAYRAVLNEMALLKAWEKDYKDDNL